MKLLKLTMLTNCLRGALLAAAVCTSVLSCGGKLSAPPPAQDMEKLYLQKSGKVVYRTATSDFEQFTTVWFDDFGKLEAVEIFGQDARSGKVRLQTRIFQKGGIVYSLDHLQKNGTRTDIAFRVSYLGGIPPKVDRLAEQEALELGVTRLPGSKSVLGHECQGFGVPGTGGLTDEAWVWEGIILFYRLQMGGGIVMDMEAVSAETGLEVPAELFAVPEGYSISRGD